MTNGLGAYCIGSSDETYHRRDHALFTALLRPPLRREKCIRRLHETIYLDGRWQPITPQDDGRISSYFTARFHVVDGLPTYEYRSSFLTLQKRFFMEPATDAFYVQYRATRAEGKCRLRVQPLLILPDAFFESEFPEPPLRLRDRGFAFHFELQDGRRLHFHCDTEAQVVVVNNWMATHFKDDRDMAPEANFIPAGLSFVLEKGQTATIRIGLDAVADFDINAVLQNVPTKRNGGPLKIFELTDEKAGAMLCRPDDFVVARATINSLHNTTILSAYPDQTDNGRNMLLALPGLLLATGDFARARNVLDMLKSNANAHQLPNQFSAQPLPPSYDGADVALWYFVAAYEYWLASKDEDFLEKNYSFLLQLLMELIEGTENGVVLDKSDGLLEIIPEASACSWMDAKVGNWVVTARTGKPIEMQALWYNALQIMLAFSEHLDKSTSEAKLRALAEQAETHIRQVFWLPKAGYLADGLTPEGIDSSFRANQVIALGLPFSPFPENQSLSVLEKVLMQLATPYGLRTLSPFHAAYRGNIGSTLSERAGAWHNGTVHPWLTWPCVRAMLRNGYPPDEAYAIFRPLFVSVQEGMVGHVSEAFTGDKPHLPVGAGASAVSLGAVIQCLVALKGELRVAAPEGLDLQISEYA
ncbi:MAG: glycogen debranching enzyme N-terminal domain-containing protein [Deferribacteres bacterium]|nr:glycogen debranching enzyme N-terminal domain-containing protein [candidate division KSB1 bacterium]MCB9509766.1 glycogen debranching enzyme N-terminal domain-containing protein [Deferribacteres bacterium]